MQGPFRIISLGLFATAILLAGLALYLALAPSAAASLSGGSRPVVAALLFVVAGADAGVAYVFYRMSKR